MGARRSLVAILVCCNLLLIGCGMGSSTLSSEESSGTEPQRGGLYFDALKIFGSPTHYEPQILNLTWPLRDPHKMILTRFGTPTIIYSSNAEHSGFPFVMGFFHEALDVMRSSKDISTDVLSPINGYATLVYDNPNDKTDPYSCAVIISDELSGLIVSMLHVEPMEDLKQASKPIKVTKGQKIGSLAPVSSMKPEYEVEYRHVHLAVLDPITKKLLDPQNFTAEYVDSVAPKIAGVYFLNDQYQTRLTPTAEKLDLVIEVSDRDQNDERNFEVKSIAARLLNSQGVLLWSLTECDLSDLFQDLEQPEYAESAIAKIIDFTNTLSQTSSEKWANHMQTDADNPNRTFRYLLNRLKVDKAGNCTVGQNESEGLDRIDFAILQKNNSTPMILEVEVSDHSGNRTTFINNMTIEKN